MKTIYGLGILGLVLAGCSSTPPPELRDARVAYARAAQSPDAQYAPADMRDAQLSLSDAEKQFDKHGDEPQTRVAAYVASRKAIAAQARGETMRNLQNKQELQANLARYKDQQLARVKDTLMRQQQEIQSERSARVSAEQKANDALSSIEGLKTSQDERGLVVTLTGQVLFASNSSTLLPSAQRRLADVANALKEDRRRIQIVGHTDSTGSDQLNQRLSESRANSVRTFLTQHGVPADRMSATGAGETQPIADNKSPEGRADNRRVEIILQKPQ